MSYGSSLLTKDEVRAAVACPTCRAPAGTACQHDDPDKDTNHMERVKDARRKKGNARK